MTESAFVWRFCFSELNKF